jgi:hypothetical protein
MLEFERDWTMLQHLSVETDSALVKTTASFGRAIIGYR